MHISSNERLRCPYNGCSKSFEKPTVLTDDSRLPRENYYACPHCNSKIDIFVDRMRIVDIKAAEHAGVFDSPAKCAYHLGFLNSISDEAPIPDVCLACPKVLQCSVRRDR